jgi:RNA polymerase sigma-70 factor (ECF subfamily)
MVNPPTSLFPTTNWHQIQAIRRGEASGAAALEVVCSIYWFPVFAFFRRQTTNPDRARDLTQGFFEQLLRRDGISRVRIEGGRFRSYLVTACRNYLTDIHRYESSRPVTTENSLAEVETAEMERRYSAIVGTAGSPDSLFDRQWALTTIDRAFATVEEQYRARDRGDLFTRLHRYIDSDPAAESHAQTAAALGLSEGAVKMELSRLRKSLRQALEAEVAAKSQAIGLEVCRAQAG